MPTDRPDGDVTALWQRQEQQEGDVTITGVRRRAEQLEAKARLRHRVFWLSIVNNVAICAALGWFLPQSRPFVAVFFLAASFAQIQALTQSTRIAVPADAGLLTSVAFLRASLERDRSSFERLWLWFLVPAGIAELSLIAGVLATGGPRAGVAALAAGIAAFFGFVFLRSRQQARRLRTEIEALPRTDG